MYEKTKLLLITLQRYAEKPIRENLFNESAYIFSQAGYLYFVSIELAFVSIFLPRGRNNRRHR